MASVSVRSTKVSITTNGTRRKIISREHLRKYSWLPDVFRLKGTITSRIFGPVLTVTIFAAGVAYLWSIGKNVTLTNSVVPMFSVVVGLILVFRNGTSYDRYYEGRKDFATMVTHIRNLSRMIWINVAVPPPDDITKGKFPTANLTKKELRRMKVESLKLCVGFAFAAKHYLRSEDGLDFEDYIGILPPSLYRIAQPSSRRASAWTSYAATERTSPENMSRNDSGDERAEGSSEIRRESTTDATKRLRVKRSKDRLKQPGVKSPKTPLLNALHQTIDFNSDPDRLSTPLPLVIAHELGRRIFVFKRDGYLETLGPAGTNAMNQLIQGMVDMVTNMERVANTPIPRSYSIHLKQCVTLYLFSLPFTLVNDLGWMMIPAVTAIAFTLMGIEGIAEEIEMPFGLDKFDLPLERYCDDLKEEVEYIVERLPEGGEGMYGIDDGQGDD